MAMVWAHRGACAEVPENTLAAFRRAIEVGADAIETDAHLTRDGVVVLSHDPRGARTCGVDRAIADCTWEEVRAWSVGGGDHRVPTLGEALRALPEVRFNVDCKARDARAVEAIVESIRRAGAEDRVNLASFHAGNLRRARALGFRGGTGLAQAEVMRLLVAPTPWLRAFRLAGQRAQVPARVGPLRLDTAAFVDKAHELGLLVDYWVIDDPAEARRLVGLGADGVMTDDPARIVPALRER